jgi:hypothetical protein
VIAVQGVDYENVHEYKVQKFAMCTTNSVKLEVQLSVVAKKKKGTSDEDQTRTKAGPRTR